MNSRRKRFFDFDFGIIASAGAKNTGDDLPESEDTIRIASSFPWFKRTYACGHKGKRFWTVSVYGLMTRQTDDSFCPDCAMEYLKKNVARCALCGLPILPGAPVALYGLSEKFDRNIITVVDGRFALGCMRWDCCPCHGFFSGHWEGENGFLPLYR